MKKACTYGVAAFFAIIVLWQGGFNDITWCLLGLSCALAFLLSGSKLPHLAITLPLLGLVLLYLISAAVNGAYRECWLAAARPAALLFAALFLANTKELDIRKCIYIAGIAALVVGLMPLPGFWEGGRLQGTFQYADAAGILFAVCAFLAFTDKWRRAKWLAPVFLICLLLTRSVGAIGVFLLAWPIYLLALKKYKTFFLILGGAVLAVSVVIIFRNPFFVVSSFVDRLIPITDGFYVMAHHPLGIGPGMWNVRFMELQRNYYYATRIHSFVAEIGAEVGLWGLLLLLASPAALWICTKPKENRQPLNPVHIAVLMLLIHGVLDLTLAFSSLAFLLLLLIIPNLPPGSKLPGIAWRTVGIVGLAAFLTLGIWQFSTRNAPDYYNPGASSGEIIDNYPRIQPKNGRTHYAYAIALAEKGEIEQAAEYTLKAIRETPYVPDGYDMLEQLLPYLSQEQQDYYRMESETIRNQAQARRNPLWKLYIQAEVLR